MSNVSVKQTFFRWTFRVKSTSGRHNLDKRGFSCVSFSKKHKTISTFSRTLCDKCHYNYPVTAITETACHPTIRTNCIPPWKQSKGIWQVSVLVFYQVAYYSSNHTCFLQQIVLWSGTYAYGTASTVLQKDLLYP